MKSFRTSISEEHGINLIENKDKNILSIGISTAGSAEIKMARKNADSHIIATTYERTDVNIKPNKIIEICASKVGKKKCT